MEQQAKKRRIYYHYKNLNGMDHDHIKITFPNGHNCFILITDNEINLRGTYEFSVEEIACNKIIIREKCDEIN